MVRGLDIFKDWFKEFSDQYVLIGGTAASLAMQDFGIPFRATKDLDVVLHLEALTPQFGKRFWKFVEAGEYQIKQRNDGHPRLYRFQKPKPKNFPWMIELFSSLPKEVEIFKDSHLTPIPIGEDISNMSAILLDKEYYDFVISGRRIKNGLAWIGEDRLIPLKAFACLNLRQSLEGGESSIQMDDIHKHLRDVIALTGLISPELRIELTPTISNNLETFINNVDTDQHPEFLPVSDRLRLAYCL